MSLQVAQILARGHIDRAISRYSRSYGVAGIPPWRGAAYPVINCGDGFAERTIQNDRTQGFRVSGVNSEH